MSDEFDECDFSDVYGWINTVPVHRDDCRKCAREKLKKQATQPTESPSLGLANESELRTKTKLKAFSIFEKLWPMRQSESATDWDYKRNWWAKGYLYRSTESATSQSNLQPTESPSIDPDSDDEFVKFRNEQADIYVAGWHVEPLVQARARTDLKRGIEIGVRYALDRTKARSLIAESLSAEAALREHNQELIRLNIEHRKRVADLESYIEKHIGGDCDKRIAELEQKLNQWKTFKEVQITGARERSKQISDLEAENAALRQRINWTHEDETRRVKRSPKTK